MSQAKCSQFRTHLHDGTFHSVSYFEGIIMQVHVNLCDKKLYTQLYYMACFPSVSSAIEFTM